VVGWFGDRNFNFVRARRAEKPSMLIDLERGNRLELEWMSGTLTRIGQEVDVPTPVHSTRHAALKLHANGPN
jgi:2-dehydropantoate 2-reductase